MLEESTKISVLIFFPPLALEHKYMYSGVSSTSEHSDLRNSFITVNTTADLLAGIIVLLKLREEAKKSS